MDTTNLSSNWKKLQFTLATEKTPTTTKNDLKRKRPKPATTFSRKRSKPEQPPRRTLKMETPLENKLQTSTTINAGLSASVEIGKYIALDCEMVGVGPMGADSALARVSIVNYNGEQTYDSFVKPQETVIDWRTHVSGIKPSHMNNARSFEEVQSAVSGILRDRVVVGHALRHDFKALLLDHPLRDTRDTSRHPPYRKIAGGTPKLSLLASQLLGIEIQSGEHSSLEDARASMLLFRRDKDAFETSGKKRSR